MKLRFAALAKRVIIAQDTNSITLVDIVEQITIVNVPVEPPPNSRLTTDFNFAVLFDATEPSEHDGEFPADFWLDAPTGRQQGVPVSIEFKGTPRARIILEIGDMAYRGPGLYVFNVECQGVRGSLPVEVQIVSVPVPD